MSDFQILEDIAKVLEEIENVKGKAFNSLIESKKMSDKFLLVKIMAKLECAEIILKELKSYLHQSQI